MPTKKKHFTILITPELEMYLNELKKNKFYDTSKSEMITYLINLGLETFNKNPITVNDNCKLIRSWYFDWQKYSKIARKST